MNTAKYCYLLSKAMQCIEMVMWLYIYIYIFRVGILVLWNVTSCSKQFNLSCHFGLVECYTLEQAV